MFPFHVPCGQETQLVSEIADNVTEYLPCAQETQLVSELAASVVEYLPCMQLIQETIDTAPNSTEYVPAGHTEHNASPLVVLYLPATHEIHVPPSTPV